ncbi:putative sirtuin [Klebsormidium nitens]|uniref:Putative sirtuin n=1 Tax=Klebsormidium nitens TaxID=105231 RepID=A0A1Y1IKC0_KLENI|nr:putative sirtuin [Klebsormidium nitens]|eukprot:GAQ89127.1 putative sirtuin [Klebsormidium nitens]
MGNSHRSPPKEDWVFEEDDLVGDLTRGHGADLFAPRSSDASSLHMGAVKAGQEGASDSCGTPGLQREGQLDECDASCPKDQLEKVSVEDERKMGGEQASTSGRDNAFAAAADVLLRGECVVAFTGAGISVESGIPDFRSPSGLWARFDPGLYCSYPAFIERPELFWTMALEMQWLTGDAEPNRGHAALVQLEQLAGLRCVVTQNVDGLHQRAGSAAVHELHGTVCTMTCVACKKKRSVWREMERLRSLNKKQLEPADVPRCHRCAGAMKMDVVLFGEALQYAVLQEAMRAATAADVILVVGTSLSVAPANSLVQQCKARGGQVIVCNLDDSGQEYADIVLQGNASDTLERLVAACTQKLDEKRLGLEALINENRQLPAPSERTLALDRALSVGSLL